MLMVRFICLSLDLFPGIVDGVLVEDAHKNQTIDLPVRIPVYV